MIPPSPTDGPSSPPSSPDAEKLLRRFDQEWRSGPPPRLSDYLLCIGGAGQSWNEPAARRFLEDLIKIDLEYRWRQEAQGPSPRLEEYVKGCPELGRLDQLSEGLIGAEYLVRHLWGDQPSHAEYARRFAQHGARLHETLRRIDAELTSEFRREGPIQPLERLGPADKRDGARPGQAPVSTAALMDALRESALLEPSQIQELSLQAAARSPEPRALAREILQRGWLTPYQVNQLLQGRGENLLLGSYLILERLGQGGAGQVFKARHQKLGRSVALKVIRKELLSDAEVVGRFYREIQMVSQLDHPNVVHAFDAGPVGATHFLAMEYVEGTDLGRLVKEGGPLPVMQACEYVRQAALGLQHAHERGLVHRDVKPHNLIMSRREGLIKLADLGLARLPRTLDEAATLALTAGVGTTGTLTPANAVLIGTADYLAPEQALDFHGADIRADIYGLGCTFYYLLTGQPPFAGATLAEKLLKHQQAVPQKLQAFRTDVSPGLEAALLRMLAKQPEKRYQAPTEVAQALATFTRGTAASAPDIPRAAATRKRKRVMGAAGGVLLLASVLLFFLFRSFSGPAGVTHTVREPAAQAALRELKALWANRAADPSQVRQAVLDLRVRYPGTPQAREAAALMMQMPSPLDRLDRQGSKAKAAWQPNELVAVLGEPIRLPRPKLSNYYVALSPGGSLAAGGGFTPPGQDARVRLWDLTMGKVRGVLPGHPEPITALAFAPNGRTLASASWHEGATVKLWDVRTGKELRSLSVERNGSVVRLAYAPDGRTLALGTTNGQVRLWDGQSDPIPLPSVGARVRSLVFAPDGQTLAVANDTPTVQFFRAETGRFRKGEGLDASDRVRAVAYAPDGQVVALGALNGPQLWTVSTRRLLYDLKSYGSPLLAFHPDGQTLVWSNGKKLWLSSAASGRELQHWDLPSEDFITDIAFACDGRHLALAANDATVYVLRLTPPTPVSTDRR